MSQAKTSQDIESSEVKEPLKITIKAANHVSKTNQEESAPNQYHGIFFAMLSALFLGLSNTLIRKAHITTGSEQAFIRYIVQGTIMSIIISITKINFFGPKESRKLLMFRGFFGALALIALHFSVKMINPSDAVALLHLNSVIVTLFARCFLNEKMSIAHLTCLSMSIIGVFFIGQPAFIFDKINVVQREVSNSSYALRGSESSETNVVFFIGISLAIFAATLSAAVAVILKKLSNNKVHYSVATIYACYFGGPVSLLISSVMLFSGITEKDPALLDNIPSFSLQVAYSLASACCGTISQITINVSLKYEDASKVSIIRSTDLFFTYVLQYFWLNISTNVYSGIGAVLIIMGAVLILVYKIVDKKLSKSKIQNFWTRILLLKF